MESLRKTKSNLFQVIGIAALFCVFGSLACDGISTKHATSTTCATGTAQIFVYDGQIQRVCGCTEGTGTSTTLNCTVDAGTRIYFHFINIQTQHQIAVTGIGSTGRMDVSTTTDQVDASIFIAATGTYPFSDVFVPALSGNIIAP